ncbi:hypothetical protein HK100_004177 [Physocladia obscura]|uniref:Alkaline ceramidase n=1 Tax=Physocladia obscura TaxID=109957 RepID=A0AAD5T9X5_9FUNG|nr:hypothetical protein HK100_004177 [Physocladia obscura]
MDELPMVIGISILTHNLFRVFPSSSVNAKILHLLFSAYAITVSVAYLYLQNPVFHQLCFAALGILMAGMMPFQIARLRKMKRVTTGQIKNLQRVYGLSVGSILVGFSLWLFENVFCAHLRDMKKSIGRPANIILEFHVLWHYLSVLSVYSATVCVEYMTVLAEGRIDSVVQWGGVFVVSLTSKKI